MGRLWDKWVHYKRFLLYPATSSQLSPLLQEVRRRVSVAHRGLLRLGHGQTAPQLEVFWITKPLPNIVTLSTSDGNPMDTVLLATFPYTPQGQKFMPEFIEVSWVSLHPR